MKAIITAVGELEIVPENGTEIFLLKSYKKLTLTHWGNDSTHGSANITINI